MPQSAQCTRCAHYRLFGECAAFPKGIPDPIFAGEHDHTQPYPGDNGIRFEPLKIPAPQS